MKGETFRSMQLSRQRIYLVNPSFTIMDKREFLENNIEDDGKRAYELDGMRAVFPSSWL